MPAEGLLLVRLFDLNDADIRRDSKQLVQCGIVVDVKEGVRLLGHLPRVCGASCASAGQGGG